MRHGSNRLLIAALAAFLPIALAGCAQSGNGAPPLAVQVPAECEPARVADPGVRAGDDPEIVLARTRKALALANGRLDQSARCQELLRQRYQAGG